VKYQVKFLGPFDEKLENLQDKKTDVISVHNEGHRHK